LLPLSERNTSKRVTESSLEQAASKAHYCNVSGIQLPILVHIVKPATVLLVQFLQFLNKE
jgi:hypothetical protein